MSRTEDALTTGYQYAWIPDASLPLTDFLSKYKPSMVQNDGTKPWIWVRGSTPTQKDTGIEVAVKEATELLKNITEQVEEIKSDATIPVRSNKKTGAKSKKEVREQVQAEATKKLKEIAVKHGYVSGKWLIFASADKVDTIWANLATSLVSGPLASTCAHAAKVATSPEQDTTNYQHLICVYVPNVYDKAGVTEVMKILLRNHGASLSGVKSDLYTTLGIDSKHASGIPSTTWKNSALLSEKESKELKDAFFVELASNKPAHILASTKPDSATKYEAAPTATSKVKPKLKKKAADEPFASDEDHAEEEGKRTEELQKKKKAKPQPKKKTADSPFDSDGESDGEEEKRKAEVKAKKAAGSKKRQVVAEDDDDDDDRPKKRKSGRTAK